MNFSQTDIDSFYKFLVNFEKSTDTEYEIRFGKFVSSANNANPRFESSISVDGFYRLKSKLKESYFNTLKIEEINTKESIYENYKKIENQEKSEDVIYLSKIPIEKYSIYEYNLRLALSSEKIIKNPLSLTKNPFIRTKKRSSYYFKDFKVDLTEVMIANSILPSDASFELEVEILHSDTSIEKKFQLIMEYLNVISKILIDNYYVIPASLFKNIKNQYLNMTKKNYFIGAQPITLHKDNLKDLYTIPYAVTEKLDGDRYFLLTNSEKECFLLSNNLSIKATMFSSNIANSLLDGELIVNGGVFEFHIFDILYHNNKDIRNLNLYERLRLCNSFEFVDLEQKSFFKFIVKTYIFKNVFLGSEIIINNSIHKNDGLIFVPILEPYVTKTSTFKWKPAALNSIDFYSIQKEGTNNWDLYVQHIDNNKTPKLVLFDTNKLPNKGCFDLNILLPNSELESFNTIIPSNSIDPITKLAYKSNTVIEFVWDFEKKMFVPIRTRWDKTLNPKKKGNFSTVACDIWKNIHNPITTELLFKTTVKANNGKDIYFSSMRKFHNQIKKYLYDKYTKNNKFLLELSSGQGGDLFKWISNKITTINGYDISEKNIQECRKRVQEQKNISNFDFDYNFYQQDLSDNLSANIIKSHLPNNTYDTVSCQFAIHYFFSNLENINNIIKILDINLKQDGIFMVTFMDNKKIDELMSQKNINYYIHPETKDIVYYLKSLYNPVSNPFNNKLKIILNGNNILTEGSSEFIVDTNFFISHMSDNGYSLVESSLFQDTSIDISSFKLTKHEKNISFLNRLCVFKKNKQPSLYLPSKNIDQLQFPCKTINLNNIPELSVYKIENSFDIISLLKCVWVGVFQDLFLNKEDELNITSLSDIQSIITSINSSQTKFVFKDVYLNNPSNLQNNNNITKTIPILEYTFKDFDLIKNKEPVFYTNWYIVLYKNNLFTDASSILNMLNEYNVDISTFTPSPMIKSVMEPITESIMESIMEPIMEPVMESITEPVMEPVMEPMSVIKKQILEEIKSKNNKITVADIKVFLKSLNESHVGLKKDLLERLMNSLKN